MTFVKKAERERPVVPAVLSYSAPEGTAPQIAELLEMMSYRRSAGSEAEADFINRYIMGFGPEEMADNLVVRMPKADGTHSKTLFSCHTDTVHRDSGRQAPIYDPDMGVIYKEDGAPLGADDSTGVWILISMLRHGIPGTYVFHYGEERGGIGSSALAKTHPELLQQFDRAIAFDRRGTEDVITHQGWERCASNEFAKALAAALNEQNATFSYEPCDTGIFTDTANYTRLIPECTNLSVGYEGEHTGGEMQDVAHAIALLDAALDLDWEALPTARDPKEVEDAWRFYGPAWGGDYTRYAGYVTGARRFIDNDGQLSCFAEDDEDLNEIDEIRAGAFTENEVVLAVQDFFQALENADLRAAASFLRYEEVEAFYLHEEELYWWTLNAIETGEFGSDNEWELIETVRGC